VTIPAVFLLPLLASKQQQQNTAYDLAFVGYALGEAVVVLVLWRMLRETADGGLDWQDTCKQVRKDVKEEVGKIRRVK